MTEMKNDGQVRIEVLKSPSGVSVYIDDHRICGSKPVPTVSTLGSWNIPAGYIADLLSARQKQGGGE